MATIFAEEKCVNSTSPDEAEQEEALSLSDHVNEDENKLSKSKEEEDFNFNPCGGPGGSSLPESEMCAADEIFFQGQILPFRHSLSTDTGLAMLRRDTRPFISRSQSMDHLTSGSSTRSSSCKSDQNSLSSGSCSSTTKITLLIHKPPRARILNQFHSHPSPTPQIRFSNTHSGHSRIQRSTIRGLFQVGLVRTPEIKLPDLKFRNNIINSSKTFGSRNSTISITSNSASFNGKSYIKGFCSSEKKKKKKWSYLKRNGPLFGGGCKCSVDAVDNPRIITINNGFNGANYEIFGKATNKKKKKKKEQRKGKKAMSRHRTFEWLKQLSLEGGPEDDEAAAA